MMDGKKIKKLVSGNANWPNSHKKQPQLLVAPIATSTNSFSQNQPCIEIKSSSLKFQQMKKERNPWISPQALSLQSLLCPLQGKH
jgi:hypothetical protein